MTNRPSREVITAREAAIGTAVCAKPALRPSVQVIALIHPANNTDFSSDQSTSVPVRISGSRAESPWAPLASTTRAALPSAASSR